MAISNHTIDFTIVAAEDLSTHQYQVIELDGTIANDANAAIGTICNKPESGQGAQVASLGMMKAKAGAAISAKGLITVTTSGYVITATSGTNVVGKNTNTAVASGEIFPMFGNFLNGRAAT